MILSPVKNNIHKLFDGNVMYSEKNFYSRRFPEQEKYISIKRQTGYKMYTIYNNPNMTTETWIGKLSLDQPGYFSRKINEISSY